MGVVYRGEDTALGRRVALKFLPPQITSDPRRIERFREEARNASSLNHPNICTIYEVGDEQGEVFIAMEYVDGRPLSDYLRENGMPVETVLRYGQQLASALEHAHERGVVHRDLKPVNIMVTPQGDVKILDFGLAKRVDPADVHGKTLPSTVDTTVGMAGTLPYMAPERLDGNDAGARSDIWSLGVVLYEMSCGMRPFRGENLYRLCTAILHDAPPPLPESVPAGLAAVTRRCLEKDPARRYQRASEVRAALEALEPSGAITISGLLPRQPPKVAHWAVAVMAAVLVAGVGVGFAVRAVRRHSGATASSVAAVPDRVQLAVLPPAGAAKPEDTAFDSGLVETLTSRLTALTQDHPLAVIPASEIRSRNVATVDAARAQFGVNLGLLISVQHAGSEDRVNFSLVDARTHEQLRGGTITASAAQPFDLQDRVAENVAQALELQLAPQEKQALESHGTAQPAAYDFYLQGRGYLLDFGKKENVENAITVFHNALEKDPAFGAGYAGLGEAYWQKYRLVHDASLVGEATRSCERAVSLDDDLSEAHVCLGLVYQGTGKYELAVSEYQRAQQLEPTRDAAQAGLAQAFESLNRFDDAEKAFRAAIALRPNYWAGYNALGTFYLRRGRLGEAGEMYTQVISLVPDSFIGYSNLGITRVLQGRYEEAIPPLEHSLEIRKTGDAMSNLGTAYFQARRYADAARVFEDAAALDAGQYEIWGNLGDAYYWAPGMRDRARAAYERAISLGETQRKVNSRNANMLSYLAEYYAMNGSRPVAEQRISEALCIAPRDPEVLYYSALVYMQAGQRGRALEALQRAVSFGYSAATIRDTPNFEPLREDPKFTALVSLKETAKGKTP